MTATVANEPRRDPTADLLFRSTRVDVDDLLALPEARALDDHQAADPLLYWENPGADEAWLAVGSVRDFVASGPDRLATVRRAARDVLHRALPAAGETAAPRVVGGFAFAAEDASNQRWREFPPAWFFLPRRLWLRQDRRTVLIECVGEEAFLRRSTAEASEASAVSPNTADESGRAWCTRVERALSRIDAGTLEKVVLSRARTLPLRPPSLRDVLRRLRRTRRECFTFAFRPGSSVFFGSTPELMVERQGGIVVSPALAGTSRRSGDATGDDARAAALLACPKNRREHAAVVAGIRAALAPLGVRLDPEQDPHVITLPEALHLRTPISGRAPADLDVLALAEALHPTPAVCGTPRHVAARILEAEEPHRGWYTGGLGWMDAAGDGEVVVALRSALLDEGCVSAFAGAGIVSGSDPSAELEETEIKMTAMLRPLGVVDDEARDDPVAAAVSA